MKTKYYITADLVIDGAEDKVYYGLDEIHNRHTLLYKGLVDIIYFNTYVGAKRILTMLLAEEEKAPFTIHKNIKINHI